MKNKILHRNNFFKCPRCGKEYDIGSIYVPSALIGQPSHIDRDENNLIVSEFGWIESCPYEHLTCSKCKSEIDLFVKIKVYATLNEELDFEHPFETKIR